MTDNNHPDPGAIRAAMDKLSIINERESTSVNMGETEVIKHSCRTIACHGGFYLLASVIDNKVATWEKRPHDVADTLRINKQFAGFHEGAEMLAADLGFGSRELLEEWADHYRSLWGNRCGKNMFDSAHAFGKYEVQVTLADIIAHWRGVADRIEALTAPKADPGAATFMRALAQDAQQDVLARID